MPAEQSSPNISESTRVETAQRLFREYYGRCFWHFRPDLTITEDTIPLIIKGLRANGGRKGWIAAGELMNKEKPDDQCH